ncbi:MAG: ABC transporter permease [Actinomycetota bacterium]
MSGPNGVERGSSISVRDLVDDVALALTERPGRTFLTALGTLLGVAALVATLGLAQTAGGQIIGRFDELAATEVVIRPETQFASSGGRPVSFLPWDAEDRLRRLNGVNAAGTVSDVPVDGLVRSVPVIDPLGESAFRLPVMAVSPGLFRTSRTELATGRYYDAGHLERGDPVAVLGPAAARQLGVFRVDNSPTIFVADQALSVIGILENTQRQPELLNAVIIPESVARARFGLAAPAEVRIDVAIGASDLIATQAPLVLAPNNPERLRAIAAPSPERVRSGVQRDLNALVLLLGGVSLAVGAIGIANVTLVSVLERTSEIGLRRALGARQRHIAAQFLAESATLGAVAGLIGTSLGILTIVVVSAARQWTPLLAPWLPIAAPLLGALIGLVAGAYPAWRAATTEPIAALRGTD